MAYEKMPRGEFVLIWLSVWDSDAEAREFSTALRDVIEGWSRENRDETNTRSKDHGYLQQHRKNTVLFIFAPAERIPQLQEKIWTSGAKEIKPYPSR